MSCWLDCLTFSSSNEQLNFEFKIFLAASLYFLSQQRWALQTVNFLMVPTAQPFISQVNFTSISGSMSSSLLWKQFQTAFFINGLLISVSKVRVELENCQAEDDINGKLSSISQEIKRANTNVRSLLFWFLINIFFLLFFCLTCFLQQQQW